METEHTTHDTTLRTRGIPMTVVSADEKMGQVSG